MIQRLFSAGAHFGFTKSRRHPTVKPYIFGSKNGTDIIDLEKTVALLDAAKATLTEAGRNGKVVVCVSTKDETGTLVAQAAAKAGLPHVTNRWIGGMMTNWSEIKKRIARLADLTREAESGELERKYTKKERVMIGREIDKLNFNFGGIKDIERIPDMMLVVDPRHDAIAIREAVEMKIPVIAITSSDNNLTHITHPVVVNDTLQTSVTLVLNELLEAYATGKAEYTPKPAPTRSQAPRPRRTA